MTDLEALFVAAYVFADEYRAPARPGSAAPCGDAELVALAIAQAAIGISSDRQFLGLIDRVLPGWFPHLPEQSQYNRRLRQLVGLISISSGAFQRSGADERGGNEIAGMACSESSFGLNNGAGAEGLEPPAYGFGDRRSTN